jgi:GTP pyrophosphokinase
MHEPFCKTGKFSKKTLNRLVRIVEKNYGKANKRLIEKAFFFSKELHAGQFRKSGELYFGHPLETAVTLAEFGLGSTIVSAGLLHDILEDTDTSSATLKKMFGKEAASLVEGVTKLDLLASESRKQHTLKNLQSLLLATTRDPRVILIKLADKLHNMRTLHHLPETAQRRIASETLLIYVPIAHKVGIEDLAVELEDLAFSYAQPETFKRLESQLKPMRAEKEREVNLAIAILKKKYRKADMYKQYRSVYSIFTKMKNTGKLLDEMNDAVILNILVSNRIACYKALGAVHSLFPPLPNKLKDFIAVPKPSLYRVLQTTVFGPKKNPVKVRIATHEMDAVNRRGAIAYGAISGGKLSKHMQQSLSKLGFLLGNGHPKKGFIKVLKLDFLTEPIYVFTSKGKLVELPKGSTGIDFAFASEKSWALHLLRVKVNGKKAGFDKKLDSGQVVELSFSKKPGAKRSWLKKANNFVSKEAIRQYLKTKKCGHAKH